MEKIVFLVFILLQIADFLTTVWILNRDGRELNPVINWVMNKLGIIPALLVVKSIAVFAVWLVDLFWLTSFGVIAYSLVLGHNLYHCNKIRKTLNKR